MLNIIGHLPWTKYLQDYVMLGGQRNLGFFEKKVRFKRGKMVQYYTHTQ